MFEVKNGLLPASLWAVGIHLCMIFHLRSFALRSKLLFCMSLKVFSQLMSQSIPTGYILLGKPWGLALKIARGGRDLTFESCLRAGNSTRAGIL